MPITRTTDLASLTAEDLAPYGEHYAQWRRTTSSLSEERIAHDWSAVTASPAGLQWHLETFRSWLLEHEGVLPTTPDAADVPDSRRALGEALATMRRREADAKRDAFQAHQDLVNVRQELIRAREAAALPFDSQHPGWRDFWLTAARNATRSGHCPEYDRHAELMGGITRDQFRSEGVSLSMRERVTYEVTVSFTYSDSVEEGDDSWIVNAGEQELGLAAYNHRYELSSTNVEEVEREADED